MPQLWSQLRQVGPALVLAAVVLGPGSITLSTIAGSLYGYQLLWVIVISTIFMIAYTSMSARIALVTRRTFFDVTREKFGRGLARIGGLFGFLAILAFQAGNNAAIGFSASALVGSSVRFWAAALFVPALALILMPGLYRKLELLVKVVVGLMIVSFAGTLLIVGVDLRFALAGLLPAFPDQDAIFLTLGMAGTTFSIAAAVYQSHLMKEKKWGPNELGVQGLDTFLGIAILGGISAVILLTSAGVIYGRAEPVFSAQGMAMQLEPLVGPAAFYLFTFGFFLASFSSLIVNPLIGATLLVDGLGGNPSIDSRLVKAWTAVAMACGLAVVLIFQGSPIELLRMAQAMAVIAFPILGFLVFSIAGDRALMGQHANGPATKIIGALGGLTILAMVLNYIRQIIQTWV